MKTPDGISFAAYKSHIEQLPFGKRLPSAVYVFWEDNINLEDGLHAFLAGLARHYAISPACNVIKLRTDAPKVSFLAYPEFLSEAHPALRYAVTIDLLTGKARHSDYCNNLNPPILHRKEQLLPADHAWRETFQALTDAEEAAGLYEETATIGFRLNWERLLASKGLCIEDHSLGHIDRDWVDPPPAQPVVAVDRHKTALRRYDLSKPVKCLLQYGLLKVGHSFFDYGCGLGTDVAGLQALGYEASGWDPQYQSTAERCLADIVNLGYVLNVIEDPVERVEALCRAWTLAREVLVVAALIHKTVDTEKARVFGDGILTTWNTFQKYFEQQELQQYIEDALERNAIPLALGVFAVFRDPIAQQEFVSRRTRRHIAWTYIGGRLERGTPVGGRGRKRIEKCEQQRDVLASFWRTVLEFGRIPLPEEFPGYRALIDRVGSAKRVLRLVLDQYGAEAYARAQATRKSDLLVYLALAHLRKPVPTKYLSAGLRKDMQTFFHNYREGLAQGRALLFAAGDPREIAVACEGLTIGWQDEQALYLHHSLVDRLPPVLRVYCGCAEARCGDLGRVDLLKLHKASGKLTFLVYDDIEHQLLPELRLRIKVNLRTGVSQVFDHSADRQVLYFKEQFFAEDHPHYHEWVEFSKKLCDVGVVERGFIGPSRDELDALLRNTQHDSDQDA